jgi:hypothetical protein
MLVANPLIGVAVAAVEASTLTALCGMDSNAALHAVRWRVL